MNEAENTMTAAAQVKNVSILDESLFNGDHKSFSIFCTADPEFLSIAAFDSGRNKFSGFEVFHHNRTFTEEQLAEKISGLALQSSILKKVDFRNVSVQFSGNRFTMVPSAVFKEEDAAKYFYFNQQKRADESIYADTMRGIDAVNIFAVPDSWIAAFRKLFDRFSIHHHLTSLVAAVRFHAQKHSGKNVFIDFHGSSLDLIVLDERKLLFANSFHYKNAEDRLYFVMMAFETLSLDAEKTEVIISGEIEKENVISLQLQKYIRHISFAERIRTASFTYGFDNLPSHYYYAAFSHILCES
jgi:hypothetical protein